MNYKKLLIFFLLLWVSCSSYAHYDDAYYHEITPLPRNETWMMNIRHNVRVREISIPGTHNSGAMYGYGSDIPVTQTQYISDQLRGGIRFLDIRLKNASDVLWMYHGYSQKRGLKEVLDTATWFLKKYPSEFILMRIKEDGASSGQKTFEQLFKETIAPYKSMIWTPSDRWGDPAIGDVRGKIIFLQNFAPQKEPWFGLDYHRLFHIQDEYTLATNWALHDKWDAIRNHLNNANHYEMDFINYLTGSSGSFPYFIASGHSSPQTSAPRLLTGLLESIETETPSYYPEFPRVHCSHIYCSIAFEGTNTLTKNFITKNKLKYVGIVVADFPGSGLINAIIETNRRMGHFSK